MEPATLTSELGLDRPPRLLNDGKWWLLAAIGLAAGPVLWFIAGISPAASVPQGIWQWCAVIGWQPITEELLFRGLLQGQLLRLRWGKRTWLGLSGANLTTSLVFTALHFLYHTPPWAAAVVLPSLAFGWLRERHHSTWSPLITHVLFNLAFFLTAAIPA
ncbi:MAG: JDVT-CTERM system CAAX-type protease [Gammaproteobacteria bacterium]|nr:JDVT-CTERM system CAAX-type protease [Gammaproteobacteria bacterium]